MTDLSMPKVPSLVRFAFFLSVGWLAADADAAAPSVAAALALKPVQQDVSYDEVTGEDVKRCRIHDIERDDWSGWDVVNGDGTLLRRFADTNADKKVDLWCYYQYGVEVYRDVDANFNGKADQYRWMATGGTRWGMDENEDGVVDRWKRISAEEVSAELVGALSTADGTRFATLLATPAELKAAGLVGSRLEKLSEKVQRAQSKFSSFAKGQKLVNATTRWVQFAAAVPGLVPAGESDVKEDLIAYENAVAMIDTNEKPSQFLIGTMLKLGDTWKLLDLPVLAGEGEGIAQSAGNFFTPGGLSGTTSAEQSASDSQTQELVSALEAIDAKLGQVTNEKDIATLNERRADVVQRLVAAADTPAERDTWVHQFVDTVSVAVQSGAYPAGLDRLKAFARSLRGQDENLRAYTEFQLIGTEYIVRQGADADFAKIQEWWLGELNGFADRYPRAPETAQAKLQLALSKEFEDKEADALKFYKEVATEFRGTESAEKAAGAVRRLESVGQEVELRGTTVDGKAFRLSQLKGRPVVLHYWATWCEPCKADMKLLRSLQARYARSGLTLVGVNIDSSRQLVNDYLKAAPMPWVQLFEDGGLEGSPLAKQFGVQTLPTMMLIDKSGRVVRHNVRAAELDDELSKLTK